MAINLKLEDYILYVKGILQKRKEEGQDGPLQSFAIQLSPYFEGHHEKYLVATDGFFGEATLLAVASQNAYDTAFAPTGQIVIYRIDEKEAVKKGTIDNVGRLIADGTVEFKTLCFDKTYSHLYVGFALTNAAQFCTTYVSIYDSESWEPVASMESPNAESRELFASKLHVTDDGIPFTQVSVATVVEMLPTFAVVNFPLRHLFKHGNPLLIDSLSVLENYIDSQLDLKLQSGYVIRRSLDRICSITVGNLKKLNRKRRLSPSVSFTEYGNFRFAVTTNSFEEVFTAVAFGAQKGQNKAADQNGRILLQYRSPKNEIRTDILVVQPFPNIKTDPDKSYIDALDISDDGQRLIVGMDLDEDACTDENSLISNNLRRCVVIYEQDGEGWKHVCTVFPSDLEIPDPSQFGHYVEFDFNDHVIIKNFNKAQRAQCTTIISIPFKRIPELISLTGKDGLFVGFQPQKAIYANCIPEEYWEYPMSDKESIEIKEGVNLNNLFFEAEVEKAELADETAVSMRERFAGLLDETATTMRARFGGLSNDQRFMRMRHDTSEKPNRPIEGGIFITVPGKNGPQCYYPYVDEIDELGEALKRESSRSSDADNQVRKGTQFDQIMHQLKDLNPSSIEIDTLILGDSTVTVKGLKVNFNR